MIVEQAFRYGLEQLNHLDSAELDAKLLLQFVMNFNDQDFILKNKQELSSAQELKYQECIRRRSDHEPVAYIIGYKDFHNYRFHVSKATLVPRPDTELLVERIIELVKSKKYTSLLELGAGTGCIAISAYLETKPHLQKCVLVEKSEAALETIEQNLKKYELKKDLQLLHSDWFNNVTGTFDLIVSNPPYLDPNYLDDSIRHEPQTALYAGEHGLQDLFYIIKESFRYLNPGGIIILEHGADQQEALKELCLSLDLGFKLYKDFSGLPRVIEIFRD